MSTGTGHLVEGGKKSAPFVASLFEPWVIKLDPLSTRVDCVFFDGASNVQKAGLLLQARFPRIHVNHCAAHCVSLFFSDLCNKLWQVRLMLVNYRRLYRMFGSGSMHSPYALFMQQAKTFNGGHKVGLIKAAGTRMAGHVYAQNRMLRLRSPLMATIASAAYLDLKLKGFPKRVEEFISNKDMWEATYTLQRCLFPMLRVLRLGDKGACGGMSKIVYYVHKTDEAISKSMDTLKDLKYFADHEPADADDVSGVDLDDSDSDDDSVDAAPAKIDDEEDESDSSDEEEQHLGEQILAFWNKRRQKLITPLALAGWFCSPSAEIRQDVVDKGSGANRLDIEMVIGKLYYPIGDAELGDIIQQFWSEFDDFQTMSGLSYSRPFIWESEEIKKGNDHVWHKLYSIPYTKVFGKVACRVCSKPLGCGQAERNWGALKHLKTGKRSHIGGDKAQKQATVYGAACIDKARAAQAVEEANGVIVETRWTDADLAFQLGLENWENDYGNVPPVVPKRIFRAWIEDWEWDLIHNKDCLAEAKLLQKYSCLMWIDQDSPDEESELCVAQEYNMEFQGGRNGDGWCVIATRPGTGAMDPWTIHCVIDEIGEYE
jgi:hypothetical protein